MSNLFQTVKDSVSALAAADRFGLSVDRSGMCCCLFHNERTASMKIYSGTARDRHSGYYCFGCGAHGTVIDLVAQLQQTSIRDAAVILAQSFGIPYSVTWSKADPEAVKVAQEAKRKKQIEQYLNGKIESYKTIVLDLCREMPSWISTLQPMSTEHCMALFDLDRLNYLADILLYGSYKDQAELVAFGRKEVEEYAERYRELAGNDRRADSVDGCRG